MQWLLGTREKEYLRQAYGKSLKNKKACHQLDMLMKEIQMQITEGLGSQVKNRKFEQW